MREKKKAHLYPGGNPLVVVPVRDEPAAGRSGHQNDPEQKEAHEGHYDRFGPTGHYHRHDDDGVGLLFHSLPVRTIFTINRLGPFFSLSLGARIFEV